MKLIKEIFEKDHGFRDENLYNIRRAVRSVVFDGEKVALILVKRDHFYKLPGGGVDEGESISTAFDREMKEELGYKVKRSKLPVGATIEYRHSKSLVQMSYVFLGKAQKKIDGVSYTDKEIAEGCEVIWSTSLTDAISKVAKSKPTTLSGRFIKERDTAILRSFQ